MAELNGRDREGGKGCTQQADAATVDAAADQVDQVDRTGVEQRGEHATQEIQPIVGIGRHQPAYQLALQTEPGQRLADGMGQRRHDRQDVQWQMAVGKVAHRVLLRVPERVEGRLPWIERLREALRHVHVAGHHHDPTLVGVCVLIIVPIVVVEPQRQGDRQDRQQQEYPGGVPGSTSVFLG